MPKFKDLTLTAPDPKAQERGCDGSAPVLLGATDGWRDKHGYFNGHAREKEVKPREKGNIRNWADSQKELTTTPHLLE